MKHGSSLKDTCHVKLPGIPRLGDSAGVPNCLHPLRGEAMDKRLADSVDLFIEAKRKNGGTTPTQSDAQGARRESAFPGLNKTRYERCPVGLM